MSNNQLVQAFLLWALFVVVGWFCWMIYFDGQVPPEMIHKVEVVK